MNPPRMSNTEVTRETEQPPCDADLPSPGLTAQLSVVELACQIVQALEQQGLAVTPKGGLLLALTNLPLHSDQSVRMFFFFFL